MPVYPVTCKACVYRSAGKRCQNVRSHNYARIVSIWNACDWWEELQPDTETAEHVRRTERRK